MKKLYLALCAMSVWHILPAQINFYVGNDASFEVKANTQFYVNGLILQPSADYSIANTEVLKNNLVSHYTVQTYASGAFTFTNPLPVFTGVIGYHYNDGDLNGIAENVLGLKVHNGNFWQSLSTSFRDDVNDYVLSNAVSNIALRELVLADELVTLPVVWGAVTAMRNGNDVRINWSTRSEFAVSHFQVERSNDGRLWLPIGNIVPARNLSGEQHYQSVDEGAPSTRLYYRIKQIDADGRSSISTTVSVAAIGENLTVTVYPNPAISNFRLTGINPVNVQKVELFDTRGALVQSWNRGLAEYDVNKLANGVYHIRVQLLNGEIQNKQLIKK